MATIKCLWESLSVFHDSKVVFVDLGVQENFNLPKLHSLIHYPSSIQLFGMMDNYNTEQSEHLHIDLAKDAYHTTNWKDEYPQMTAWLERRERIEQHATSIDVKAEGSSATCSAPSDHQTPTHVCSECEDGMSSVSKSHNVQGP